MCAGFQLAFQPPPHPLGRCLWFIYQGKDRLLVRLGEGALEIPHLEDPAQLGVAPLARHYLGRLEGAHCLAAALAPETPAPEGHEWRAQRWLLGKLPYPHYLVAGVARQVLDWDLHNRFCGACGTPMQTKPDERAKLCPSCGLVRYPRLSPAVIMRVTDGRRILLARQAHFPPGVYSVLAGFVEPGETLEEAVAREVREETGLEVSDVRYFGSQPWALPDSLMLAFTAHYAGGEMHRQQRELEDVAWFEPENLPRLPGRQTIARQLIEDFLTRLED